MLFSVELSAVPITLPFIMVRRLSGVQFGLYIIRNLLNREYDYRPNWTTRTPITNL